MFLLLREATPKILGWKISWVLEEGLIQARCEKNSMRDVQNESSVGLETSVTIKYLRASYALVLNLLYTCLIGSKEGNYWLGDEGRRMEGCEGEWSEGRWRKKWNWVGWRQREREQERKRKKEIERNREKGSKMETEQRNGDRERWMREVRKAEMWREWKDNEREGWREEEMEGFNNTCFATQIEKLLVTKKIINTDNLVNSTNIISKLTELSEINKHCSSYLSEFIRNNKIFIKLIKALSDVSRLPHNTFWVKESILNYMFCMR